MNQSLRYRLIIFDLDGTLAKKFRAKLLPNVESFFHLLKMGDCQEIPKTAIATNQGGVGLRYWMEKEGFGEPQGYPKQEDVYARIQEVIDKLEVNIKVYVCFRYQDSKDNWSILPPEKEDDPRWQKNCRKPRPGMLLQAMADFEFSAQETLFVGDSLDDYSAAHNAGCAFQWASEFFAEPWNECRQLSEIQPAIEPTSS